MNNGKWPKIGDEVETFPTHFIKQNPYAVVVKNKGKVVNIIVSETEYVIDMGNGDFSRARESELYKYRFLHKKEGDNESH